MLLRMLYDDKLAQAAYLIGCQRTGEAIVIDPQRDVDRYADLAKGAGLRITAVAETHIHADFASGARELAERTGAKVFVSGEGGPDWQSGWLDKRGSGGAYPHHVLKHNDTFRIGNIELRALHTPGHTPEHLSFFVTDHANGVNEPMGILTGDFVFVGDVGRPDLLETAAGQAGQKELSARQLHASLKRFLDLPDHLQVWPGHGAGSACGKALGAVPQSTVGYERRFNPAVRAAEWSADQFTDFILSGQPEPPLYFARMKRLNKAGPAVLNSLPHPPRLTVPQMQHLDARSVAIIDTRPWDAFRAAHIPESLFIPIDGAFPAVAGSYIKEGEPVYLVIDPSRLDEAVRDLIHVGHDTIAGYLDPADLAHYESAGGKLVPTNEEAPATARDRVGTPSTFVLDVRRADEFAEGRIPGALNVVHTRLPDHLPQLPRNQRILINCRSGARSARAAAYLQRAGYDVANLAGGFLAWEKTTDLIER